jgi:hypothetical protein
VRTRFVVPLLPLLMLVSGSCSSRDPQPFPGSAASLDALGQGVLAALTAGNRESLESFRLTEEEHNEVVWPELPASAPEVNFPIDFAWQNIQVRNQSALGRISASYRGGTPVYRHTECRGETGVFETFEVMTDCWVLFQRADSLPLLEAQVFEEVLARGGGYKIFRYYDEETRSSSHAQAP